LKTLILILIGFQLFAYNSEIELFNRLFTIFMQKHNIKVYTQKYKTLGKDLKIVHSCKEADIVLGESMCNKPRFLLDYYSFKNDKEAIGAFYWRKGRPQLRLRKEKLKKYNLYVSKNFEDYLE